MLRCYITDRRQFPAPNEHSLHQSILAAATRGVDWVQLREKDLPPRRFAALTRAILDALGPDSPVRLIVNTRLDVALACGAHGLHLPSSSPSPRRFRLLTPPGFLLGVSCHNKDELRAAEQEGADYAFLSPIFDSPGKAPALGLARLEAACRAVQLPVLALGGVTWRNAPGCVAAGAAGVAGIRLYQESE